MEDINITESSTSSSQDGILIGSIGPAQDNLLVNIHGSNLKNVIHISSNPGSSPLNASDVTILGVTRAGGTNTIEDDLTPSGSSTNTILQDASIGMYTVGDVVQAGSNTNAGHSRFTTSPNAPTWLVGASAPGSAQSCAVGDLYSCDSSSCASTLWECESGTPEWVVVK